MSYMGYAHRGPNADAELIQTWDHMTSDVTYLRQVQLRLAKTQLVIARAEAAISASVAHRAWQTEVEHPLGLAPSTPVQRANMGCAY